MATLDQALQASAYVTAVADAIGVHGHEAIASAEGHDGFYGFEIVDTFGNRLVERHTLTLDEINHDYHELAGHWWPMREEGEWGEEAEANRHPNDGEPLDTPVSGAE